jgi:coatomer subunit beta'
VSRIVALWRNDLKKINQKAAESLADPEEYPNLFPDWESALAAESELREQRSNYIPAAKYLSYINGDEDELTEELEGLDINGDEPAENGHGLQEGEEYVEEVVHQPEEEEVHQTAEAVFEEEAVFEDTDQIIEGEGEQVEVAIDGDEEPSADD